MKELTKLEQIEDKIINDGILLSEISTLLLNSFN